jgi:hypothetical protein
VAVPTKNSFCCAMNSMCLSVSSSYRRPMGKFRVWGGSQSPRQI